MVKALKVLCNASERLLLSHKAELLAICDRLQFIQVINNTAVTPVICTNTESLITNHADQNLSPATCTNIESLITNYADQNSSPTTIHHSTYSNMHRPTTVLLNHEYSSSITSHSDNPQSLHSVQDFIEKLNKDLEKIEKTIEKTLCYEHQSAWMTDDSHIVDFVLPENDQSLIVKFWRALSQQSLTVEFDAWEQNNYSIFKVNKDVNIFKNMYKQTYGHTSKFFKVNRKWFGIKKKEIV